MELTGKISRKGRAYVYGGNSKEVNYLLRRGIGLPKTDSLLLKKHEALFLWEFFNVDVPSDVFKQDVAKYVVFRDLFNKGFKFKKTLNGKEKPLKTYSREPVAYEGSARVVHSNGSFVIAEGDEGLFKNYWFGQKGMYKKGNGKLYVLDMLEAFYLKERGILKGNFNPKIDYFEDYYSTYKEWRDAGFVLKTGFKFGGDFRIYKRGVSPLNVSHSKHVLHVFPEKMITTAENWSRSIRVCHAVRKTYLLAVPSEKEKRFSPDFAVSKDGKEAFVKVIKQNEKISGSMLHSALSYAMRKRTDLLLAIVDRETSSTYYRAKRVVLEGSETLYFEIEWLNLK